MLRTSTHHLGTRLGPQDALATWHLPSVRIMPTKLQPQWKIGATLPFGVTSRIRNHSGGGSTAVLAIVEVAKTLQPDLNIKSPANIWEIVWGDDYIWDATLI